MDFAIKHIERSKCESSLSYLIELLCYRFIYPMKETKDNTKLYAGHIDKLILLINEKLKDNEDLFEGKLKR